jgi:glycosyltransferase involved in cell wall biosynthesis
MRVIIDGRLILPTMTGVGRYLLGLVPALVDANPELGLELWLQDDLPANHPVWSLAKDRLRLRKLPIQHMSAIGQLFIPRLLASSHPDIFHYPHFDLPWLVPGSVVTTIHDLKYIACPGLFPHQARLRRWAIRLSTAFSCRRSRLVITDSDSTAQDLVRYLGIPKEKIRTAPLGIDPLFSRVPPPSEIDSVLHRYGLERPYLLFVGERRPHKNLGDLIEAFALFRSMVSRSYRMAIVGKRYSDYTLPEKMTQERGLLKQVRFIDSLPDSDLPALYHAADAFVLLSLYEGFGLPVLEAMASGVPVVVSNRTSLPEVAGKGGILVSPGDPEQAALALCKVIPGGEMREACIAAGFEQVKTFSWERCARLTNIVYQEAQAL